MAKYIVTIWKIIISIAAIMLAFYRIKDPVNSSVWLDSTFILLLAIPPLAFLFPWDRLKTFKAVGVELALESPSAKGAIAGLEMSASDNREIRRTLYHLRNAIEDSKGSRILWIDDHPEEILGERRILRALGVEVLSAKNSNSAKSLLEEDNDFDIIISDMQRKSDPESEWGRYGGIEYIKKLRGERDPVSANLPVIFYTAYRPEQVETILDQLSARNLSDIHFCFSVKGLLEKLFEILPVARAEVTKVKSRWGVKIRRRMMKVLN